MKSTYLPLAILLSALACIALVLTFAGAGRAIATNLLVPEPVQGDPAIALARELSRRGLNAEDTRFYVDYSRRFPPELSPLLQIREREPAAEFATAYLRMIQSQRFPDRRFLLILGASEAGHHACNTEHCVTRDLAALAGPDWNVINLTRHGQTLCETARFLEEIRGTFVADRFALAITVNPVFFAERGQIQSQGEITNKSDWTDRLEQSLARRFGTELLRRAVFGHMFGVSPAGPWQMNWLGPIGPALLPEPAAENMAKLKPRRPDFAYYTFPGTGPTPARDWRAYHADGRIDLGFAAERVAGLDLKRGRACLVDLKQALDAARPAGAVVVHTALNPGLLRLLDERFHPHESYFNSYEKFKADRNRASARLNLPSVTLEQAGPAPDADFVDLDHPSPAGHAKLAAVIARSLPIRLRKKSLRLDSGNPPFGSGPGGSAARSQKNRDVPESFAR